MTLNALKRFAEKRPPREHCDLCGAEVAAEHPHLVEPAKQRILCACQACALLFDSPFDPRMLPETEPRPGPRFRRVPRDIVRLADFKLSDEQWALFDIPIGVAFFFRSSPARKIVAFYPSPAGAVESLLPLESWNSLAAENPALDLFEPDVEALLVRRIKNECDYFRAPIDVCYRLAGLIRTHWRGFTGGVEVWKAVDDFFLELRAKGKA